MKGVITFVPYKHHEANDDMCLRGRVAVVPLVGMCSNKCHGKQNTSDLKINYSLFWLCVYTNISTLYVFIFNEYFSSIPSHETSPYGAIVTNFFLDLPTCRSHSCTKICDTFLYRLFVMKILKLNHFPSQGGYHLTKSVSLYQILTLIPQG